MDIKDIDKQKEIFNKYANKYIENATEKTINGYIDKKNHSYFVLEEALLTDALFTQYNPSFKNLLALESLFHDIGRFEQLKVTGTFEDVKMKDFYPDLNDHGDLGARVIDEHNVLKELIPDVRIYDDEVKKVIQAHVKNNPELLNLIMKEYLDAFRNYDLHDLFISSKAQKEREVLTATNTAIVQDVDRLDIFRKIVKGIWIPMTTDDSLDPELFELFKQGKLPTINEIKASGKWNPNMGHLVRMNFINQMNLVPVLMKIRNENLIDQIYEINGNEKVKPAYDYAKELIEQRIEQTDDGILINRGR